jgi:orotidine-5'-phosphate decarboxylase
MTAARDSLCVALDSSDRRWILQTARELTPEVGWLKLGLEAFVAFGPSLVKEVAGTGCRVFLDLKLHDIPTTVRRTTANAASCGAHMITVHASGGRAMLEAAIEGATEGGGSAPPRIVAVTLLTSLDEPELEELGIASKPESLVVGWARLARRSGLDGVVASAREAATVRECCGPNFTIVTPGIRPKWHGVDDQRRTLEPAEAIRLGATILVVGRPITRSASPVEAARRIVGEIAAIRSE